MTIQEVATTKTLTITAESDSLVKTNGFNEKLM